MDLYHNVYQLWRLPGKIGCEEEMEAHICQKIMDSLNECLWCKQKPALQEAELRQSPANVPRLNPQAEFNAGNCTIYDRFMDIKQDFYEETLAKASDAH